MSITRNSLKRPAALFAAAALLVGTVIPVLQRGTAYAAQVTERKINMSDAAPSGGTITSGVGSGTNVTYKVSFKAASTSTNIGAIVVDICDNTPLIGDTTCSFPTGFSWGAATPTLVGGVVTNVSGTWTASSQQGGGPGASSPQVLVLTNSAPATPAVPGDPITFEISGITNPSASLSPTTSHSFYARILTFATGANQATDYTVTGTTRPGTLANMVDYGGVAMALSLPITVTARVMETLSLCTASVAYTGTSCVGPAATDVPSVILGHGTNNVLDTSAVDTKAVYSQISTNAANGYALYLRASNSCAGLSKDGGTTCGIPAVNAGGSTSANITAGTAAFGATVSDGAAVGLGTGTNTAVARWKTTAPAYIMDNTTSNDHVTYTYGSKIAESSGQANGVMNSITFAATASPTTAAGIYTENFSLIGVGTF